LGDFREVSKLAADPWTTPRPSQAFPLFRTLMSPTAMAPDYMHSKHLGIDTRFLGSVCWLIIFKLMDQRLPLDERLANLLLQMQESRFDFFF